MTADPAHVVSVIATPAGSLPGRDLAGHPGPSAHTSLGLHAPGPTGCAGRSGRIGGPPDKMETR